MSTSKGKQSASRPALEVDSDNIPVGLSPSERSLWLQCAQEKMDFDSLEEFRAFKVSMENGNSDTETEDLQEEGGDTEPIDDDEEEYYGSEDERERCWVSSSYSSHATSKTPQEEEIENDEVRDRRRFFKAKYGAEPRTHEGFGPPREQTTTYRNYSSYRPNYNRTYHDRGEQRYSGQGGYQRGYSSGYSSRRY